MYKKIRTGSGFRKKRNPRRENNKEKNMKKQIIGLALSATMLASCTGIAACGRTRIDDGDDGTKTVLTVANYAGGFGEQWIVEMKNKFEEKYAETEFEPGKKGAVIKISQQHDGGTQYFSKVDASPEEVFFIEDVDYAAWVNKNKMLDITDVVNAADTSDGKTILSKLNDEQKSFYDMDGKYYALPHHDHQTGLIYDVDLFTDEGLFYAKNGAPSEAEFTGTVKFTGGENRSAGPDGQYGTADDGLPATYDEFYALCDYMTDKNSDVDIKPILWSGTNKQDYIDWLLAELTADYEGREQLRLNYTFDGTAKNLIEIDKSGNVTALPETTITSENGYMIYKSAGRYNALKFLEKIVKSSAWYDYSKNFGTLSQTEAQYQFLLGATGLAETRFAILADGCWWENEATTSFDRLVDMKGEAYSKASRNFAFMPLPKATVDKIGERFTIATTDVTTAFIKSTIKESKVKLAKEFLKFCYAEEQLQTFNKVSGSPASVDYTLGSEDYAALSSYAKSLYDVRKNVVSPYSQNPIYVNNYGSLKLISTFTAGGDRAVNSLKDMTAEQFFRNLYAMKSEASWTQSYSKYF